MKKLFLVTAVFWASLSVAAQTNLEIADVVATSERSAEASILSLVNITDYKNTIANLHLRYFTSADCSGDPIAQTTIFNKLAPVIVKQHSLLKVLGAAVYNLGQDQVGDERMSQVSSIAVRLGGHLSDAKQQAFFYSPEQFTWSKSYCIKNVVCANNVCQSIDHFMPQSAFIFSKQAPQAMTSTLQAKLQDAEKVFN